MKKRNTTTESHYHNYRIMTDEKKKLSADKNILKLIEKQFDYADRSKSKTFFMRYDVRLPQDIQHTDNKLFISFQAVFMKNLSRQGLKPQYIAVREQSREKHQHYHVALFLDGQKTQSVYNHIHNAERLWESKLGLLVREEGYGLIDACTRSRDGKSQVNGVLLNPRDSDYETKRDACFYRASYLAKVNTKKTPRGQREIFASRIPNKK